MKKVLHRIFIDGLSGMALGLFATLIFGTIIEQVAKIFGDSAFAEYLIYIASLAKTLMGAGIGIGVAVKLKSSPLTAVSAAVCGLVGAFPLIGGFAFGKPGEPLGAFIAAYVAVEIGALVSGKTKLDIILTPFCCIICGSAVAFFIGPYLSDAVTWLGQLVNINVDKHPIIGGMVVSTLMGIFLTLPISSAAIGVSMGLTGLAAGAATVGCCCNMIGFAVISYRDNKMGGLIAQGIGTSMLQMPNIMRHPLIWLPSIISSAVLGPISSAVFKMVSSPMGSGMGTAGLVGPFEAYRTMVASGFSSTETLILILAMYFILPAVLCLGISEAMRKLGYIKNGYLKLNSND